MIWPLFAVVVYAFLVLQRSLVKVLALQSPWGTVEPQILLLLGVVVGMFATTRVSLLAWGVLGLMMDLSTTYPVGGAGGLTLIGPYTLGFLAAGYTLLQMRTVVFREHAFSLAFTVVACGVSLFLVVGAVFTVRQWYSPLPNFSATGLLLRGLLISLYTAVFMVFLARPLLKLAGLLGVGAGKTPGKRASRR